MKYLRMVTSGRQGGKGSGESDKNTPDNKEGEEPWEVSKNFLNTKSTNYKRKYS